MGCKVESIKLKINSLKIYNWEQMLCFQKDPQRSPFKKMATKQNRIGPVVPN